MNFSKLNTKLKEIVLYFKDEIVVKMDTGVTRKRNILHFLYDFGNSAHDFLEMNRHLTISCAKPLHARKSIAWQKLSSLQPPGSLAAYNKGDEGERGGRERD